MSEGNMTVFLALDTIAAETKIAQLMAHADAQVADWKLKRDQVMRDIRTGMVLISSFMASARMALALVGEQIDPFFSALISMTTATVSMMLSMSAAMSVTVLGAPVGAMLAAAAITLNVLSIGNLIKEQAKITNDFESIRASIDANLASAAASGGSL